MVRGGLPVRALSRPVLAALLVVASAALAEEPRIALPPGFRITEFASGLTALHYFVDYIGMRDGMAYVATWFFDGEELLSVDLVWDEGESGTFTDNVYRKSGDGWQRREGGSWKATDGTSGTTPDRCPRRLRPPHAVH